MSDFDYSDKYEDDLYEYRHVILPDRLKTKVGKITQLYTEAEWRQLGVQQSRGWVHYAVYNPEPHILLFRRPRGTDPTTGQAPIQRY